MGNNIGESVVSPADDLLLDPPPAQPGAEGAAPPDGSMHSGSTHHSLVGTAMHRITEHLRTSGSGTGTGTAVGTSLAGVSGTMGSGAQSLALTAEGGGSSAQTGRTAAGGGAQGALGAPLDRLMSHAFLGRAITRKTMLFRGLRLKVRLGP